MSSVFFKVKVNNLKATTLSRGKWKLVVDEFLFGFGESTNGLDDMLAVLVSLISDATPNFLRSSSSSPNEMRFPKIETQLFQKYIFTQNNLCSKRTINCAM
jgi:hypothetical protein